MARGDKHGNREAKKPKKVKPKEATPVSTFASVQKHVPATQRRNKRNFCGVLESLSTARAQQSPVDWDVSFGRTRREKVKRRGPHFWIRSKLTSADQ
jgi:hypothetical protein